MSDDTRAKRMSVRFTDDDLTWIAEHAEDEGVEPATLVRMIINRLRRGRPPLMSMIVEREYPPTTVTKEVFRGVNQGTPPVATAEGGDAEDVLAARLAELDGGNEEQLKEPAEESAAIPMRRVARQQYNPGRN